MMGDKSGDVNVQLLFSGVPGSELSGGEGEGGVQNFRKKA